MKGFNRRTVIRRSVGTAVGTALISGSSVAAESNSSDDGRKEETIHGDMEITDSGLSQEEFRAKRSDDSGFTVQASAPGHEVDSEMIWVDAMTGKIDLSNSFRNDGKVEMGLRVYRAPEKTNGEYIYMVLMDLQWKPDSGWGDHPWLKDQSMKLEANDFDVIFRDADPIGELYKRERGYDISVGATLPSGAGISLGSTVYVKDGIQHCNRNLDRNGYYEMVFDGDDHRTYDPLTSVAVVDIQSDEKYTSSSDISSNFDWDADAHSNMDASRKD